MALELSINGSYDITIVEIKTKIEVSKNKEVEILRKLQSGEMIISMNNRTIAELENLQNPIYSFEMDVNDETEYEFDEAWEG